MEPARVPPCGSTGKPKTGRRTLVGTRWIPRPNASGGTMALIIPMNLTKDRFARHGLILSTSALI